MPLPNANKGNTAPPKKTTLVPSVEAPNGFRVMVQSPMGKWETPGQQVYAYFLGMRPSTKYPGRRLLDTLDDDGVVTTWPCPIVLEQCLLAVERRTMIFIHYRGEDDQTKQFDVFVSDAR